MPAAPGQSSRPQCSPLENPEKNPQENPRKKKKKTLLGMNPPQIPPCCPCCPPGTRAGKNNHGFHPSSSKVLPDPSRDKPGGARDVPRAPLESSGRCLSQEKKSLKTLLELPAPPDYTPGNGSAVLIVCFPPLSGNHHPQG